MSDRKRALIVGFGSIGKRHYEVLSSLGWNVAVVSRRQLVDVLLFSEINEALEKFNPSYVVVANETSSHFDAILRLSSCGYTGSVLVEKPVFSKFTEFPANQFKRCGVAYNLRFHPAIQRLRTLLLGQKVLSVNVYVGQYLPLWRPGRNYVDSYSADAEKGGGVLLDLSHEVDYLLWLFGDWSKLVALKGKFSHLQISSEDVVSLLYQSQLCPVISLSLNYLDRVGRREIIVNTDEFTVFVNLVNGDFKIDNHFENFLVERNCTYQKMHEAMHSSMSSDVCSVEQGLAALRFIESVS